LKEEKRGRKMNKTKKTITILIITIILLSLVICYLLFKLNKLNASDSNEEQEVKTKEETKCQSSSDINCIYYEENGIKIERKLDAIGPASVSYEINGKFIGEQISYHKIEIKQIIDNKYIIVNQSETSFDVVYDLNGDLVFFDQPDNMWTNQREMEFSDNKLIIKYYYRNLDLLVEYHNDYYDICTDEYLDGIVYLKQEVEYSNGNLGTPKIIEKKTLKEYSKEFYDKDC
jgi:flagellar basal body-associated protein FliL